MIEETLEENHKFASNYVIRISQMAKKSIFIKTFPVWYDTWIVLINISLIVSTLEH